MSLALSGIPIDTQTDRKNSASAAVGFTLLWRVDEISARRAKEALWKALRHFDDLESTSIELGRAELEIWGREELSDCYRHLPDGSLIVNIGAPLSDSAWKFLNKRAPNGEMLDSARFGGDGRYVHLWISPDGNSWTFWNDWLGSIPVYHSRNGNGHIISTIEPVVVAAADPSIDDIYLPGLLSLLVHGNYLSDWTLYDQIKVLPPDCIAKWESGSYKYEQLFTVKPSDAHWETGWNELAEGMHELSKKAITDVLRSQAQWILPLSGGLDSRLIAAVGAELNCNLYAYTYGPATTKDVVYAQEIAKTLEIPWKRIDLGNDFLVDFTPLWADLFGSAMHFHGMYQMPFYQALASEPVGPLLSGLIGECLTGYDVDFMMQLIPPGEIRYQAVPDGYLHWPVDQLQRLFKVSISEALETVAAEIQNQIDSIEGPWFQRLRFFTLWGRQRRFTNFQSILCDYVRGVGVPYLNKEYAQFCFSLPRAVLDGRRLQADMFARYYPKISTIPVQMFHYPFLLTAKYLLQRKLARNLPEQTLVGPLRQFKTTIPDMDVDCVRKHGWQSFWPLKEVWDEIDEWVNTEVLEQVYEQALGGSIQAVRQLQSVQPLAYRLQGL
jgi:hypothetical protein